MSQTDKEQELAHTVDTVLEYVKREVIEEFGKRIVNSEDVWGEWDKCKSEQNEQLKKFAEEAKPVLIVVVTPKSFKKYKETECYKSIKKVVSDNTVYTDFGYTKLVDLFVVERNTKGLSKVYNKFLDKEYENHIVCFMHDDVIIRDADFYRRLITAHEMGEVVGVAGATRIQLPLRLDVPTSWVSLAREVTDQVMKIHGAGSVIHQTADGKQLQTPFYGLYPTKAKLIDGLFMSFNIKECLEREFRFDERFTYHHYDLAASLRALKCGMEVVISDIILQHNSHGNYNSKEWSDSHEKFVKYYKEFNLKLYEQDKKR